MENSTDTDACYAEAATPPAPRTWDARLARWLVTPLKNTRVVPNHLTTLRLAVGLAGAYCLAQGGFAWANAGALFVVLSNFIDHTDGELARISGKSSKLGHFYDLASDAFVTVALFVSMGIGIAARGEQQLMPIALGTLAGVAVALIFYLRMRIESFAGKAGTKQGPMPGASKPKTCSICCRSSRSRTVSSRSSSWRRSALRFLPRGSCSTIGASCVAAGRASKAPNCGCPDELAGNRMERARLARQIG